MYASMAALMLPRIHFLPISIIAQREKNKEINFQEYLLQIYSTVVYWRPTIIIKERARQKQSVKDRTRKNITFKFDSDNIIPNYYADSRTVFYADLKQMRNWMNLLHIYTISWIIS